MGLLRCRSPESRVRFSRVRFSGFAYQEEASAFKLDPLAPLQLPPGRSPDLIAGLVAMLRDLTMLWRSNSPKIT